MIYEFTGLSGRRITTTDPSEAEELRVALDNAGFELSTFDPADNGSEFVYLSPEDDEKQRCYTAWGYN
jgi:hypothetical protein